MSTDVTPSENPSALGETPLLGYASGLHIPVGEEVTEAYCENEDTLVVANGSTLVQRCILCGGPGVGEAIRLTLTWDSTFRLTRKSTLELRKEAIVYAYLCLRHRARWTMARLIGGVGIVASLTSMSGGMALSLWSESSDIPAHTPLGVGLTIAGFAGMIVSLFFFTLRTKTLSCSRIQEGYLYLQGASGEFLKGLPTAGKVETGQ